jgi:hypothetical protein
VEPWELQKFLDLALEANPNVLECLWTSNTEAACSPPAAATGMAVRRGLRLALHCDLDASCASTPLPARPDYEAANAYLLKALRSAVEGWV